jgi:hypothetical protein
MNMSEAVLEGKRDSVDAQRLIAIVGDSDRAVYSVGLTVWCRRTQRPIDIKGNVPREEEGNMESPIHRVTSSRITVGRQQPRLVK